MVAEGTVVVQAKFSIPVTSSTGCFTIAHRLIQPAYAIRLINNRIVKPWICEIHSRCIYRT